MTDDRAGRAVTGSSMMTIAGLRLEAESDPYPSYTKRLSHNKAWVDEGGHL